MIPGHVRLRRFIELVSQTNLITMSDRREHLLPARIHHGVSKTGKDRIDRCRRQFRRNATSVAKCFSVLGVLQSFPGAETDSLDTMTFFADCILHRQSSLLGVHSCACNAGKCYPAPK